MKILSGKEIMIQKDSSRDNKVTEPEDMKWYTLLNQKLEKCKKVFLQLEYSSFKVESLLSRVVLSELLSYLKIITISFINWIERMQEQSMQCVHVIIPCVFYLKSNVHELL